MSKQDLTVSVALCTFNGARFIGRQLESILGQSRPPDEVIICDDRSSDETVAVVQDLASKSSVDVRILENQKNLGVIRNFQQALEATTGDVIFLSDQDDVWFRDKVATMMAPFSESERVGLVYCDALLVDAATRPTGKSMFESRKRMRLQARRSAWHLIRGIGFNGCMMAFRSSLKDLVIPFSEHWGHDHWIAFIAYAVTEVRPIAQCLMYYRRHGTNFGADPDLDARWWEWQKRKLRYNLRQVTRRVYKEETRLRLEALLGRLQQLRKNGMAADGSFQLNELIEECEGFLEFSRRRGLLAEVGRAERIAPALHLLLSGDYHRHAQGLGSLGKDLLVK